MPASDSAELKEEARSLIYWGQVPVRVVIGDTEFSTALFPKDGRYMVPLKDAVRRAEGIGEGDVVAGAARPARAPAHAPIHRGRCPDTAALDRGRGLARAEPRRLARGDPRIGRNAAVKTG